MKSRHDGERHEGGQADRAGADEGDRGPAEAPAAENQDDEARGGEGGDEPEEVQHP